MSLAATEDFLGQLAHFVGHHGKAAPRLAGARGLDRGIERQQIGLVGDFLDRAEDAVDALGELAQGADVLGDRGGVGGHGVHAVDEGRGGGAAERRGHGVFLEAGALGAHAAGQVVGRSLHVAERALQAGDAVEDGRAERGRLLLGRQPGLKVGELGLECIVALREVGGLPLGVQQLAGRALSLRLPVMPSSE
jgi:hypothetical protein